LRNATGFGELRGTAAGRLFPTVCREISSRRSCRWNIMDSQIDAALIIRIAAIENGILVDRANA
jgi:hypothetical protein